MSIWISRATQSTVKNREILDMILTYKTQIVEQCFMQEKDLEPNVFGKEIAHP